MPLPALRCRQADKDLLGTGHFPTINIPGFVGGAPQDSHLHSLFFVSVQMLSQPGSHAAEEDSGDCRAHCGASVNVDTPWQIQQPCCASLLHCRVPDVSSARAIRTGDPPLHAFVLHSCPQSEAVSLPALCLKPRASTVGSLAAKGAALCALLALIPAHNLCSQPAPACLHPLHAPQQCRQPVPALPAASKRTSLATDRVAGSIAGGASSALMLLKRDPFSDVKLGPLLGRGSYGQAGLHATCATVAHAPARCSAAARALQALAAAIRDQHPMAWHSTPALVMAVNRWPVLARGPDWTALLAKAQRKLAANWERAACALPARPGDGGRRI